MVLVVFNMKKNLLHSLLSYPIITTSLVEQIKKMAVLHIFILHVFGIFASVNTKFYCNKNTNLSHFMVSFFVDNFVLKHWFPKMLISNVSFPGQLD